MTLPHLSLSLGTPGFELLRTVQWLMVIAIAALLSTAGSLWWTSREMERQAVDYEQATARVQEANRQFISHASREGYDLSEDRIRGLAREVSFANQLLEKGAFSWTRMLSDLEEAIGDRVSFSSVKLSFKDSVITLTGTALTLKDLTAQIDKLEGHPVFSNVVLSQHQVQEDRESGKQSVNFVMTVMYRPR